MAIFNSYVKLPQGIGFHGEHTIHDSDLRSAFKEMSRQYREMQAWGPQRSAFNQPKMG